MAWSSCSSLETPWMALLTEIPQTARMRLNRHISVCKRMAEDEVQRLGTIVMIAIHFGRKFPVREVHVPARGSGIIAHPKVDPPVCRHQDESVEEHNASVSPGGEK